MNESNLTKGQLRKLNALRKSLGSDIADEAFEKWLNSQAKNAEAVRDPVADALVSALDHLKNEKSFRLGRKGYIIKRAKGRGASGFVAEKLE